MDPFIAGIARQSPASWRRRPGTSAARSCGGGAGEGLPVIAIPVSSGPRSRYLSGKLATMRAKRHPQPRERQASSTGRDAAWGGDRHPVPRNLHGAQL
jgi:hypothetical protein